MPKEHLHTTVIELKFLKSSRLFLSPCDGRDGSVATKQPSLFFDIRWQFPLNEAPSRPTGCVSRPSTRTVLAKGTGARLTSWIMTTAAEGLRALKSTTLPDYSVGRIVTDSISALASIEKSVTLSNSLFFDTHARTA